MARIPLVDHHEPGTDPKAAALLAAVERGDPSAPVLNVLRALANHPDVLEKFLGFARAIYAANSLEPRQRELPYLTSAVAIQCFY